MKSLTDLIKEHSVFRDLSDSYIEYLCHCAQEEFLPADKLIFKTGEPADKFYLIESGRIAVQVFIPPKGTLNILTLNSHEVLGWSWLYPPYVWHFEARALTDTQVIRFDGVALRQKCEEDKNFGYTFMKCFSQIMVQRLAATRLQLLDIFGKDPPKANLYSRS